jgi:integrase
MALSLNRLSARFITTIAKKGTYGDGGGLFLQVGICGQSKSWIFMYRRGRLDGDYKSPRGYVGLGSVKNVSLADARIKAQECRDLLGQRIDPKKHYDEQIRKRALTKNKNAAFLTIAEAYIADRSNDVEKPWRPNTRKGHEGNLHTHLKPLHDWPCVDITPLMVCNIIKPMRLRGLKSTAHHVRTLAAQIIEYAKAHDAFPDDKINPASMKSKLRTLLNTNDTEPISTPHPALHYSKMPALFAKLALLTPRTRYTMGEAARAVGKGRNYLYNMIRVGRLVATKPERPIFPNSWQHWEIEPEELFKVFPQVADVIPGIPAVSVYVLQYQILCANRPGETLGMRWDEYDPVTKIWRIPWQRLKMGWRTRQDHYVPLSEPAIRILDMMQAQQRRDNIPTPFVFANYKVANPTSARVGQPPARHTVRNLLEKNVDAVDVDKTLHGMRTAFGSWARDQGYMEADIERALSHAEGRGSVRVARIYGRDATREVPLRQLLADWADYCLHGALPAEVTPIRAYMK